MKGFLVALAWVATLIGIVLIFVVGDRQAKAVAPEASPPVAAAPLGTGPWSHPDAATIRVYSEAAGVPYVFAYAIAWEETRNNVSPTTRSYMGAVGRFQIMPATAKASCPGLNIYTSSGNLACFLKLVRASAAGACAGDYRCVARVHNGSGRVAEAFADSVMSSVRKLVTREIER